MYFVAPQVVKIKDALNRYVQQKTISVEKKKGITVGSTEIFQGQGRSSAAMEHFPEYRKMSRDVCFQTSNVAAGSLF